MFIKRTYRQVHKKNFELKSKRLSKTPSNDDTVVVLENGNHVEVNNHNNQNGSTSEEQHPNNNTISKQNTEVFINFQKMDNTLEKAKSLVEDLKNIDSQIIKENFN